MDRSSILRDEVTTAITISETSPRTEREAFESKERKKPIIDPPRRREEDPEPKVEHFAPPNVRFTEEILIPQTTKKVEKPANAPVKESESRIDRRNRARRIVASAKKYPIHRAIGAKLFDTTEAIKEKADKALRDVNLEYNPHRDERTANDVDSSTKKVIHRIQNAVDTASVIDRTGDVKDIGKFELLVGREIDDARTARVREIDAKLREIESAGDERQLADILINQIPSKTYESTKYVDPKTGETALIKSTGKKRSKKGNGEDGLETVIRQRRQAIEKVIHPATLLRDGITEEMAPGLWERAKRAEEKLAKAYPYVRDSFRRQFQEADKVDFHPRTKEKPFDDKFQADRDAAKQATILREAARVAKEAEDKRLREEALRVERERVQREAAEKKKKAEIDRVTQEIRKKIKESIHTLFDFRDSYLKTERARILEESKEALRKAYNQVFASNTPDEKARQDYFAPFYGQGYEQSKINLISTSGRYDSAEQTLRKLGELVEERIRLSETESDFQRYPITYRDPIDGSWYSKSEFETKFGRQLSSEEFEYTVRETSGGKKVEAVTTIAMKKQRRIEANRAAQIKFDRQFDSSKNKKTVLPIVVSPTLTLEHTRNHVDKNDANKILYYLLEGEDNGIKYRARLTPELVLYDIKAE